MIEFSWFERDLHDNFNVYQIRHFLFIQSFWHLVIISRQWSHSKLPQVTQSSFLLKDNCGWNSNQLTSLSNNINFDPFTFLSIVNYDFWNARYNNSWLFSSNWTKIRHNLINIKILFFFFIKYYYLIFPPFFPFN